MAVKEGESVRTTIHLPADLHEKLRAEADKEKRSRHSQMLVAPERFFETRASGG